MRLTADDRRGVRTEGCDTQCDRGIADGLTSPNASRQYQVSGRSPGSRVDLSSCGAPLPVPDRHSGCSRSAARLPLRGQRRHCIQRLNAHRLPVSPGDRISRGHPRRTAVYARGSGHANARAVRGGRPRRPVDLPRMLPGLRTASVGAARAARSPRSRPIRAARSRDARDRSNGRAASECAANRARWR